MAEGRTGRFELTSNDKQQVDGADLPQEPQMSAQRRKQGAVIGQALRKQFETILTEPVPEDLIALLDELERREVDT